MLNGVAHTRSSRNSFHAGIQKGYEFCTITNSPVSKYLSVSVNLNRGVSFLEMESQSKHSNSSHKASSESNSAFTLQRSDASDNMFSINFL